MASFLKTFVTKTSAAGCHVFIIHARKALLKGLSPKQNREIPPLRYEIAEQVKKDFPQLTIILNGGIKTLADITQHLQVLDGVMIGREAYKNPYLLAEIESAIFHGVKKTREEIFEEMLTYIKAHQAQGGYTSQVTRHMLGLYHGEPHGKQWRQWLLSEFLK